MKTMELVAPCHFGLEAVLKREIINLGYEISYVEDGKVCFIGDAEAICRANLFIRTAERILIHIGSFHAETFEELFEGTKKLPWEDYIPENGRFWVAKATSIKSKLFSPSDIQSIMKKAMVEHLKQKYHKEWFEEDGDHYPIRVSIMKDEVHVYMDTSGDSLHKRGYRLLNGKAPISETLAAALILLTPWKSDRILVDPFCGSGTFPIEAAMIGSNMAPGLQRSFLAEKWENLIPAIEWQAVRREAEALVDMSIKMDIQAFDIDGEIIKAARENARRAGVEKQIHFQQRPVKALSHPKKYGFLITNPPYGERIETKESIESIYRELGEQFVALDNWSAYIISSCEDTERYMGRKADKKRKIYNGMMKTCYYQFLGAKPPKARINSGET